MTHNQDWDVEKYSTPHEPKHHWQLKKKFMEHHKDRFPESELVSSVLSIYHWIESMNCQNVLQVGLAQTFGNMEFLGCQYPKETMDQINELSFGIVTDFREERKGKLQRTFVSGSTAANKKVNRLWCQTRISAEKSSEKITWPDYLFFQINLSICTEWVSCSVTDPPKRSNPRRTFQREAINMNWWSTPMQHSDQVGGGGGDDDWWKILMSNLPRKSEVSSDVTRGRRSQRVDRRQHGGLLQPDQHAVRNHHRVLYRTVLSRHVRWPEVWGELSKGEARSG